MADAPKNTQRRDKLLEIQAAAQRKWAAEKCFEADAPAVGDAHRPKYFANFPYPYMNGTLHLGHAFTYSKIEFATAFHRLCGDNVLFPQGFHCTGMPIKACADKLKREFEVYGNPPVLPSEDELVKPAKKAEENADAAAVEKDPAKFSGKKSKAAAKKGAGATQYEIMKLSGVPENEIPRFQESLHWLSYFPPLAKRDLQLMGCGIDWRRSFITTDVNPYYDSFIRWQFETLRARGKVVKDKRLAVYSPLDGQPCADHDRASGEGVGPQEYTLIKMHVLELPARMQQAPALAGKQVFLAAATLRPETMYGQTNCWVLPDGDYGCYAVNDTDVFVVAERAARNMSFQGLSREEGKMECLLSIKGRELIGTPVKSPLAIHERIYCLPLLTILMSKGTGVVTSVPSDAPDDYVALQDLKNKPAFREKYGVRDEWVLPFEVIPIINIPEFGDTSAVKVCGDLKIKSQNDKDKLAEAKHMTYLKGFTDGVMLVGEHKGQPVKEAKPLMKAQLVASGEAVLYSEPEKQVMSRSGDECVVALTDQWYLLYGEEEWRDLTQQCVDQMNMYHDDARNSFNDCLTTLHQWACSRSFGLGTRLPWDEEFLIESLSDSTIYMAYYTFCHLLHEDMYGEQKLVQAQELTKEVWDYILLDGELPVSSAIGQERLQRMKREFDYWYPFDLRVSGKDLIRNHLTFCLYNHTAIFKADKWPKAFRCNGHLLLNSEKMSKSTGNFKTLNEACKSYSADAMRFAMADAGDTMDDANFVEETANSAILRLTKELAFFEEVLEGLSKSSFRTGNALLYADKVFANEMCIAVAETRKAYEGCMFREALKAGFYDLQNARDMYRNSCGELGMAATLLARFVELQVLLLTPICPHFCEHVWGTLLGKPGSVTSAGWPTSDAPDYSIRQANQYLEATITDLRKAIIKAETPPKKKGAAPAAKMPRITHATVFVAEMFEGWRATCLEIMKQIYQQKGEFGTEKEVLEQVKASSIGQQADFKKVMAQVMPFIKYKSDEAKRTSAAALELRLPFSELQVLRDNAAYIKRALKIGDLQVFSCKDTKQLADLDDISLAKVEAATPENPASFFSAGPKPVVRVEQMSAAHIALAAVLAKGGMASLVTLRVLPPSPSSSSGSGLGASMTLSGTPAREVSEAGAILRYLASNVASGAGRDRLVPAACGLQVDELLEWSVRTLLARLVGANGSATVQQALETLDGYLAAHEGSKLGETIAGALACALLEQHKVSVAPAAAPSLARALASWRQVAEWSAAAEGRQVERSTNSGSKKKPAAPRASKQQEQPTGKVKVASGVGDDEEAKRQAKKLKAVLKEGGKKGQDIIGAAEMGGLEFFCTAFDEPEGNVEYLRLAMGAANKPVDPSGEERRGGSGEVGKMLFSAGVDALAIGGYVPPEKRNKVAVKEWISEVLKAVGTGQVVGEATATECYAVCKLDADKGLFPLKMKDTALQTAINYLRAKGCFPDDNSDDDDDDYAFGDDAFEELGLA